MTEIGNTINSGELEVIDSPSHYPDFIGLLKIPNKTKDLEIMYFKDYAIVDGKAKFEKLKHDSGKEYTFDMCYMRIPSEFQYVVVNDNGEVIDKINHEQNIFGFVLLNIHIHKTVAETDIRTARTPAQSTYLSPKFHYGKPHKDNPDALLLYAGLRGCSSLGFFGKHLPLFYANRTVKDEKTLKEIKKEQYFILSIGTEETIGYGAIDIDNKEQGKTDLKKELNNITSKISKIPPGKYKFGVKLFNYERYDVGGFENKYGVHIIEKTPHPGSTYKDGWLIDWFEIEEY